MKTSIKQRIGALATTVAILGVVVSPAIVSAAPATSNANTTVNVTVSDSISISTLGTVAFSIIPVAGGALSSGKDTVTVSTNNTSGYNLKLADSDATTTLTSAGGSFAGNGATPAVLTAGKWGFGLASGTAGIGVAGFDASYSVVSNATSPTSKWAGVPASGAGVTLKSTSATATNDATDVYYAAMADTSQPNGVYTDTVTYTATNN